MPKLRGYEIIKETILKWLIPVFMGSAIAYGELMGSPPLIFNALVLFGILAIITLVVWAWEIHKHTHRRSN